MAQVPDFKNAVVLSSEGFNFTASRREVDSAINKQEDGLLYSSLSNGLEIEKTDGVTIDGVTYDQYSAIVVARYVVNGETFLETSVGHLFNITESFKLLREYVTYFFEENA